MKCSLCNILNGFCTLHTGYCKFMLFCSLYQADSEQSVLQLLKWTSEVSRPQKSGSRRLLLEGFRCWWSHLEADLIHQNLPLNSQKPVSLYFESRFYTTYLRGTGIVSWQRRTPQVFKSRCLPQGWEQVCLPESKSYCHASWYAFPKRFSPLMLVLLHKICRKGTLPLFINAKLQLNSETEMLSVVFQMYLTGEQQLF